MADSKARTSDREWLLHETERFPEGWASIFIAKFGMEGALDLLAVQSGRVHEVNTSHKPFRRNPGLKRLVYVARNAVNDAMQEAYRVGFAEVEEKRQKGD